jgi:hypothetical protein
MQTFAGQLCTRLILGQLLDQPFPVSQPHNRADTENVREGASCGGGKQAMARVKLHVMRRGVLDRRRHYQYSERDS